VPARNCIDLIPGRMRWLLAALLPFAAACGEDVTPVAPTTPVPEPRVCTDELERARAYIDSILPREWDGTPFRFDLFDHFPEIAGADYLDGQLEEVRGLAERIEEQIGYPIIEAGSVIPVRANLPQGWNGPPPIDLGTCDQWREPGQALGIHLTGRPYGHQGQGPMWAAPGCALVGYWVGDGLPSTEYRQQYARTAIVHEIFHLFGFKHSDNRELPEPVGVFMSRQLTGGNTSGTLYPTFNDMDALRCVFAENRR